VGVFDAATFSVVGNGESTYFWTDRWIDGRSIKQLVLALFTVVRPSHRRWYVADTLPHRAWVRDISGALTTHRPSDS